MKTFTRIVLYVGFPLVLVMSIGAFYLYGPRPTPISIDNHVYDVLLAPDEIGEEFHLYFLYQYPRTNYIVAKFIKQTQIESTLFQNSLIQTEKIIFIDTKKWKRTLAFELEYSIRDDISKKWFYSMNRLVSSTMLRMDDRIIHRFHYSTGRGLAKSMTGLTPWATKIGQFINAGQTDLYSVDSGGELLDEQHLSYITPVMGTDTFFANSFNGKYVELNQFTDSNVKQLNLWDSVYSILDPIYLGNDRYFIKTHNEPGVRILVDSKPPKNQLLPIKDGSYIYKTYSLTTGRYNQPAMLLFLFRGYGEYIVYEVDSGKTKPDSIFEPGNAVYKHLQKPPFTVMSQNQVLVFQDHDINLEHDVLKNSGKLYYSIRERNEDGSPGKFNMVLNVVDVPDEIELISKYPYDDEHLLLYGDNAIWTMKWDGIELKQVFPSHQ